MKDETKEIKISKSNHSIVIIKNGVTVKEQFAIDDEILDYITNLQQENKSNINRIHELEEEIDSEYVQKEYYKSRNEKAIEYIKNKQELNKMFGTITLSKDSQNELLSILGGDDNDKF